MKNVKKIIYSFIIVFLLIVLNTTIVKASSTKINAPENVKASVSGVANAKIKWSSVEGAKKYTIYRVTSKKGKYKKVGTSKSTSFKNKDLTRGKTYYFKVVANGEDSNSKKSVYAKVSIPSKKKVLKKIRNALKDKKWVKNNIKIKDLEGYSQVLYFGKVKNKELIVVEALSEQAGRVQMFLVGYDGGKIVATSSTEGPMNWYNGGAFIDLNKGIAGIGSLHMGYEYGKYFKVANVKFKALDEFMNDEGANYDNPTFEVNGKKVSRKKYNAAVKKYSKYNFGTLQSNGYKLTSKNIDKYVK